MPGLPITNSPNITYLDSKIIIGTCTGKFYIDVSPSVFIGSGAANVAGVKVKITNPYGVIIKDYTDTYDIPAPVTSVYEFTIPTQAGKQQPGDYIISVQLTDSDDATYEVTKNANVCSYKESIKGCENLVLLTANCKTGKLIIQVSNPPTYRGVYSQSKTQTVVVDSPTASGVAPLTTSNGNFSVALFEGVYRVKVTYCATYNLGDNVLIQLGQEATFEKNVKCALDYTCIYPRIQQISDALKEDCSQRERERTTSIILDALRLITTANLAVDAGADPSDYIADLEKLLGCTCTCDCNNLPIINGAPSSDVSIEGCNVESEVVGLTTVYTINNYAYLVTVDPNQSVITVSAPSLDGCTYTQQLGFSIQALYTSFKTQVTDDELYWAGVINIPLAGIDATCLGYTSEQWAALTFTQKFNVLKTAACIGGVCSATITGVSTSSSGSSVLIEWTQTGGYSADVFVDGIYVSSVLAAVNQLLIPNASDGASHTYIIIPKCTNGSNGTSASGTFAYAECPSIAPPTLSSSNVEAECPFDLTTLPDAPPMGITIEWHNQNNTLPISLVGNPEEVSAGVYYAFAKDANGCYSSSSGVTVVCESTSCTAPQALTISRVGGDDGTGYNVIRFASASAPPPLNSYTVKRKLASDPDIDPSYTTIGTPTFDPFWSKWTINDFSDDLRVLYTYKAISNCASTTPSIMANYATLPCPSNTITPGETTLDFSFAPGGGEIDKFEVRLFDATGVTQLYLQTFLPAFSNPITGTFSYLTPDTDYLIQVTIFIGTYSRVCTFTPGTTSSSSANSGNYQVGNSEIAACAASPITLYWSGVIGTGTILYTTPALDVPATGFSIISIAGPLYNVNSGTGEIGSLTGNSC